MQEPSIFERILAKEIPADIVFEDEDVLAFRDVAPQAPVHILVIPKQRAQDFADLPKLETNFVGRLFQKAAQVADQLELKEYRIVSNCGTKAGQSVFYLHLHILGGRSFTWPPG